MLIKSSYTDPTIWVDEINTFVIKVLKIFSDNTEIQADRLILDFQLEKKTYEDDFQIEYFDDPTYQPASYEYYEGFDGLTFALDDLFEDDIPSLIRSSALISIYSSMEFEIQKLCNILQDKEKFNIRYVDLKNKGLEESLKYLSKIAEIDICKKSLLWNKFINIRRIRNIIVHYDGVIPAKHDNSTVKKAMKTTPGIDLKFDKKIIIKNGFLDYLLNFFSEVVEDMGKQLNEKYKLSTDETKSK